MKAMTLRLPDSMADAVKTIAWVQRIPRSDVIRQAIDAYLERKTP